MGKGIFLEEGGLSFLQPDVNTLLLIRGDAIIDGSRYHVPLTNNGVVVSSEQSKFGGKSLYFDGQSKITFPSQYVKFGASDWTIDWWERCEVDAKCRFCTQMKPQTGIMLGYSGKNVSVNSNATTPGWDVIGDWTILSVTPGEWVHWAVVRFGNVFSVYKNGNLLGTKPITKPLTTNDQISAAIGTNPGNNNFFKGYMDEFRVSNVARWTENFTPQTMPY